MAQVVLWAKDLVTGEYMPLYRDASGRLLVATVYGLHHLRHEVGGDDEISVAGLSGELADNQPPKAHLLGGAKHTADSLADLNTKVTDATLDDVGGPRDPNAHAASHEDTGADEIDAAGLSGELADQQKARVNDRTWIVWGDFTHWLQNIVGSGVATRVPIYVQAESGVAANSQAGAYITNTVSMPFNVKDFSLIWTVNYSTISANGKLWYRISNIATATEFAIMNFGFGFRVTAGGALFGQSYYLFAGEDVDLGMNLNTGQYYILEARHIVGDRVYFYVDNVLKGSSAVIFPVAAANLHYMIAANNGGDAAANTTWALRMAHDWEA